MKSFEIGKKYSYVFANGEENYFFKVVKRTAKTITITDGKNTYSRRINKVLSEIRNAESVFPYGEYSMAPILSADRIY